MTATATAPRKFLGSRRSHLLAGAIVLGLAGVLSAQTILPGQPAFAEAVRVQSAAPADFSQVVTAVQPAVVSVRVKQAPEPQMMNFGNRGQQGFGIPGLDALPEGHPLQRFFERKGEGQRGQQRGEPKAYGMSQGSGFFISDDGYVVTNHHVIDKGTEFTVIDNEGNELEARLIGADPRTDLALLKVEGDKPFTYVRFADDAPAVGEWVVAIGNPFGLGGTVTAGIVSARGRDIGAGPYDDFIQIDAPVNRGNSGGPAFNMKGEVIGVNAAIFSPSGGNVGIAFAIPASTATDVVGDLKDSGAVVRGWLGVQIQPVTGDIAESLGLARAEGAIVSDPQSGSPADKAGIKAGDTILKVDGKPIKGPRDLSRIIASYAPDTKVKLAVWRDGAEENVTVTLGTLIDPDAVAQVAPSVSGSTQLADLGIEVTAAKRAGLNVDGVVVTAIDPNGRAAQKGLREGDIIAEVAGQKVTSAKDVEKAIAKAEKDGRKAVLMRVFSDDAARFVAVPLA
ncbi:Do family serine endopeptidase [Pannonibacter carbonis]|uniref:Do family serine endopeptidase n=1 Tax=Pannonibacter carbonis TaxID=2067569 RepID=UPI000D0EB2F2|nr:Do family serine endopeptidase [Pannonibacter carbonis]